MRRSDFTVDEFQARRKGIYCAIGGDAVAVLQGAPKERGHALFRQDNDFYYLCGVETPHAYLLLDGRSESTTLYLPHQSAERAEREGVLPSAENADEVQARTGVDHVRGIEFLVQGLEGAPVLYTPLRQGRAGPAARGRALDGHGGRRGHARYPSRRLRVPARRRHALLLPGQRRA
jgi:Xaa-Pro aminopeptidase